MKHFPYSLVLALMLINLSSVISQNIDITSNSLASNYINKFPQIYYNYDEQNKIHDYSQNWDLDGDSIKDDIFFLAKDGAHLFYYLKVVLSSSKAQFTLPFIETDLPVLTASDTLNFNKCPVGFVVCKLNNELTPCLIVRLQNSTLHAFPELSKNVELHKNNVIIRFNKSGYKLDVF